MNSYRVINEYLKKKSWRIKENANFNYNFSGLLSHIADKALANYALSRLPKRLSRRHIEGDFHIHNLSGGLIIPYCYGGNLYALLQKGIKTPDIRSKPARHLDSAVDHIVNYIFMTQLEWSGAIALSDVDTLLAPFVRKDKLSYKQVRQNIQRMIYNLNFPCRQAFQTPFSNITLNMIIPKYWQETPIVVGGEILDETYADYEQESRMIFKAICEVLLERDPDGRPFTFPIPTFNLTSAIDPSDDEFLDMMQVSAAVGSFYYYNYVGSGIDEYQVRAMCCRLNLRLSDLKARGYWNLASSTGSIGVVTLNLPRLGYLSKDDTQLFERLDRILNDAKEILLRKRKLIHKYAKELMPFTHYYGVNFNHFFNTIGVLGMHEMCINYTGNPINEEVEFVQRVLKHILKRLQEFTDETGSLWNLEMTPAESACYRLALIDRKKYPDIKTQGTKRAPYYTALLMPPALGLNFTEQIDVAEKILPLFTGGTVFRIFLGDVPHPVSLANLTMKIAQTKIPYFDYTCTFSLCPSCKQITVGEVPKCPHCGNTTEIYSRVVGYYRKTSKYNPGKLQEFKDRKYMTINQLLS